MNQIECQELNSTSQFGVTSVLTVDADLSKPTQAVVSTVLSHYEVLEGVYLSVFIFVEVRGVPLPARRSQSIAHS
jgi:hypothetical protein